jgi:hypothetical protein
MKASLGRHSRDTDAKAFETTIESESTLVTGTSAVVCTITVRRDFGGDAIGKRIGMSVIAIQGHSVAIAAS